MSLSAEQVEALLRPIKPQRVMRDNKGMAHVSQQDVRAHLTRMFGFGGWSSSILNLSLVREAPGKDKNGQDKGWAVTYRATVRLDIRDPHGQQVCSFEDVATGTSPNLPTLGDAHDFACKVAVSMALKRAATNLGDGFGLSLYNKGQTAPLVIDTLIKPDGQGKDASDDVPEQVSFGHDDAGSVEAPPEPGLDPSKPRAFYDDSKKAQRTKVKKGDPVPDDPWAIPVAQPPTEEQVAFAADFEREVAEATHEDTLRELWKRLQSMVKAGDLPEAMALDLKNKINDAFAGLDLIKAQAEAKGEPHEQHASEHDPDVPSPDALPLDVAS